MGAPDAAGRIDADIDATDAPIDGPLSTATQATGAQGVRGALLFDDQNNIYFRARVQTGNTVTTSAGGDISDLLVRPIP